MTMDTLHKLGILRDTYFNEAELNRILEKRKHKVTWGCYGIDSR